MRLGNKQQTQINENISIFCNLDTLITLMDMTISANKLAACA